jgi:hypothetical protein
MSVTMLLYIGAFVFAMMLIGLGLTIREFSIGEPVKQAREAGPGKKKVTAERKRGAA